MLTSVSPGVRVHSWGQTSCIRGKIIWFIILITFKPIHHQFFWSSELQSGLPFARLKLKPVQRMSLLLDYEVEAGGPEKSDQPERILNKRQSRAGLAVGGKCQVASGGAQQRSNSLGQCFLCQDPATTKVTHRALRTLDNISQVLILTDLPALPLPQLSHSVD